jgi:hypothetical protein
MNFIDFSKEFRGALIDGSPVCVGIKNSDTNIYADDFFYIPTNDKIKLKRNTYLVATVSLEDVEEIKGLCLENEED